MEIGDVFELSSYPRNPREFPKEIQLGNVIGQFPLPTEYVIHDLSPKFPLMGRIYRIEGQGQLCAVEVWGDYGDDGHTDMELTGAIILSMSEIASMNDPTLMKTSRWLHDHVQEMYLKWWKGKKLGVKKNDQD